MSHAYILQAHRYHNKFLYFEVLHNEIIITFQIEKDGYLKSFIGSQIKYMGSIVIEKKDL